MSLPAPSLAASAPRRFDDPRFMVPVALGALYILWGSTYLGIRYAVASFPPFLLAGMRFLVAGGLLLALLRLRGVPLPSARQWRNAAVTGFWLLGLGNGLVCYAEQEVASGVAAVAVASMPLFMAVFAGLRGNWPTRLEAAGIALGFVGVVVLNLGGQLSGSPLAALALVAAAAAWAWGSVWSKHHEMPPGAMNTAAQMLTGAGALVVLGGLHGESLPAWSAIQPASLFALGYLVVFGSLFGFSAYLYVLKHARPALATSYAYVNPPVAVGFGALIAGERLGLVEFAGMATILAGVCLITLRRQRRRA